MNIHSKIVLFAMTVFLSMQVSAGSYYSQGGYKITVTNITKGISFTPFLAATHNRHESFFSVGESVSDEVSRVAEGGDISALNDQLTDSANVHSTASTGALLMPGESVELMIDSSRKFKRLSLISMLLPTNDTVVALQGVRLPKHGKVTYLVDAYDAGTETNDEFCANIPGPHCGGAPFSPEDDGEGYAYPSPAIHGLADLSTETYQWNGPVAKVVIERMYK